MDSLGRVPTAGDQLNCQGVTFPVEKKELHRVIWVLVAR